MEPSPRPDEPRSWERPMKIDPITKTHPSNADLARQGNQLHDCLESAHSKIDNVTIVVDEIKASLAPKGRKAAGLSTPLTAFLRTAGATATSIGGMVLLYKVALVAGPIIVSAALAVDHAIRTGGL